MTEHPTPLGSSGDLGVWLEVKLDTQPITGELCVPGGVPQPFVGWLGLTALLDALRRGAGGEEV